MLSTHTQPIQRCSSEGLEEMPLLRNSSLWEAARWSVTASGLTILQGLCAIVTCICAATWGRDRIRCNVAGDWLEQMILWAMILAGSGQGKSTMLGRLLAPFKNFEEKMNGGICDPTQVELQMVAAEAVKVKKKAIAKALDLSKPDSFEKMKTELESLQASEVYKFAQNNIQPATIILPEATKSGFRKVLERNGYSTFIASTEPETISAILKKGNVDILKMAYNQEPATYITNNGEIKLPSPSISILNAAQTDIFLDWTTKTRHAREQASGFWGRMLVSVSNPDANNSGSWDPYYLGNGKNIYEHRIGEFLKNFYTQDRQAEKYNLGCSAEAMQGIEDIRQQIRQMQIPEKNFEAWLNKYAGNVARIAGAIHMWEHGHTGLEREVGVESIQKANEMMNALFLQAKYLYTDQGLLAETNAIKIQESLNRISDKFQRQHIMAEGISTTAIQQRIHLDRQQINDAFRHLQATNWCVILDRGNGNLLARFRPEFFGINSSKVIW